jgi:hypothetical protein
VQVAVEHERVRPEPHRRYPAGLRRAEKFVGFWRTLAYLLTGTVLASDKRLLGSGITVRAGSLNRFLKLFACRILRC